MIKKKILFFFVHPAKFHLFRATINHLIGAGNDVEVLITGRDFLEELVKGEGWAYRLLFPKGRKIPHLHVYLSASINLLRTIYKLWIHTLGKKYDVFVTDDLLTYIGRVKKTPTIFVTDDDLSAVPESQILASANYIFAPSVCDMKRFEGKKLGYKGYKALAHLHPNRFVPRRSMLKGDLPLGKPYYFLRLVSPTSTHDVGKTGLDDQTAVQIINLLKPYGRVIVSSERRVPPKSNPICIQSRKKTFPITLRLPIFLSATARRCAPKPLFSASLRSNLTTGTPIFGSIGP